MQFTKLKFNFFQKQPILNSNNANRFRTSFAFRNPKQFPIFPKNYATSLLPHGFNIPVSTFAPPTTTETPQYVDESVIIIFFIFIFKNEFINIINKT